MMPSISEMPEVEVDSSVDLLLKAQAGDSDSLNRLLTRYVPRLQRWASGRLPWGLRTMLDTADLVQDAIISALPHLNTLEVRTERAFQYYLQRAVKNRVIDLHKRARRRPVREEIAEDVVAAGTSPLEAAVGSEVFERYERALGSLKKQEREAVMLRVEMGLTYEEIAAQLRKASADAARMTVTRGIVRLAEKMGRRQRLESKGHGN